MTTALTERDAEVIASDEGFELKLWSTCEVTGPLHVVPEPLRQELGVELAPEGYHCFVLTLCRNGEVLRRYIERNVSVYTELWLRKAAVSILKYYKSAYTTGTIPPDHSPLLRP
jgi:hypothetical protein